MEPMRSPKSFTISPAVCAAISRETWFSPAARASLIRFSPSRAICFACDTSAADIADVSALMSSTRSSSDHRPPSAIHLKWLLTCSVSGVKKYMPLLWSGTAGAVLALLRVTASRSHKRSPQDLYGGRGRSPEDSACGKRIRRASVCGYVCRVRIRVAPFGVRGAVDALPTPVTRNLKADHAGADESRGTFDTSQPLRRSPGRGGVYRIRMFRRCPSLVVNSNRTILVTYAGTFGSGASPSPHV